MCFFLFYVNLPKKTRGARVSSMEEEAVPALADAGTTSSRASEFLNSAATEPITDEAVEGFMNLPPELTSSDASLTSDHHFSDSSEAALQKDHGALLAFTQKHQAAGSGRYSSVQSMVSDLEAFGPGATAAVDLPPLLVADVAAQAAALQAGLADCELLPPASPIYQRQGVSGGCGGDVASLASTCHSRREGVKHISGWTSRSHATLGSSAASLRSGAVSLRSLSSACSSSGRSSKTWIGRCDRGDHIRDLIHRRQIAVDPDLSRTVVGAGFRVHDARDPADGRPLPATEKRRQLLAQV